MSCSSGTFWISPALENGDRDVGAEFTLRPAPTNVDYGERLNYTTQQSDAKVIKQRYERNPNEKKWIWKGYRSTTPLYEDMYWSIFDMQESVQVYVHSGSPYVYLKDCCTEGLRKYNPSTNRLEADWIRARIVMVKRTPRDGGGPLVFEDTELVFTIDEDTLNYTIY